MTIGLGGGGEAGGVAGDGALDHPAPERRAGRDRGRRSLTASEAAALIGVSVASIRHWADQGRLPSHRTEGGHRRFEVDELRVWLSQHGAPAPQSRTLLRPPRELIPCPELARELNSRTEAIVERVLAGFHPDVPTPLPVSSPAALRRLAIRLVRAVAAALESGRPAVSAGRIELAGYRGGLQGASGAGVMIDHNRVSAAILGEAEDAVREGRVDEPLALACLHSVIDSAQLSVLRGFEQARGERSVRTGASRPPAAT